MSILSAISSHEALLTEFRSITGLTVEDHDDYNIRAFLQACDWNLEIAVGRYFDNPDVITTFSSPHDDDDDIPTNYYDSEEPDYAPLAIPASPRTYNTTQSGSLMSYFQTAIFLPFTLGGKLFTTLMYILSFIPRFGRFFQAKPRPSHSQPRLVNPEDTARKFIRQFHADINDEDAGPEFVESGYTEVISLGKSEHRFVLVILQSDECDNTSSFNRDVLASNRLSSVLAQHNVLVWGGNVAESEAYQVAHALHCTQFPFSALIALSAPPGSSSSSSSSSSATTSIMTVLTRLQGPESTADLSRYLARLLAKLETHGPTLAQMRDRTLAINLDREAERQIRRDQDDAYARSLARDRELRELQDRQREAERLELIRQEQQRQESRLREAARISRRQKMDQWRNWRAHKFLLDHENQPSSSSTSSSTSSLSSSSSSSASPSAARISIRLANGQRIVKSFTAQDCLEDIYAYVECRPIIESPTPMAAPPSKPPTDYTHQYSFELVAPMPRQVLEASKETKVAQCKVIWPSGTLVVEELDEDSDDEN